MTRPLFLALFTHPILYLGIASLERLMKDFSLHYKGASSAPAGISPKSGELVAAKFSDGSWYRARVGRVSSVKKEAEVTFIDYGNRDTVSFSNVRPLDAKFKSLPGQAHDARLRFVFFLLLLIRASPHNVVWFT